jgi:GntR family transcriptional regulator / MocR family aminotransferase
MPFSKHTIYMKLYEQFKTMINENKYQEHDKLPSKRKLAASLKISPLTVQAAYEQLMAEGYVYAVEKSGYYVSKKVEVIKQLAPNKKPFLEEVNKPFVYDYEFKTNIVDTKLFPSATWAKLTREVLAENHHETLNVTDPQGILKLREEITRYIEVYRGIHVDPNQIVIGSGGSQLMHIILDLLGRKQHYAIENPNYLKIYYIFKASEVKLSLIPLDQFGLIVDHLNFNNANIVHVTPSHQFPTGIVMPIQRRNELLNWANQKEDRYIIEDDYDSEFRYQGSPIPALQSLDSNDKVIYINTFTKDTCAIVSNSLYGSTKKTTFKVSNIVNISRLYSP